ncbi:unnamed protein product [Peronospora farinosa]|uniref:Uncharacterized protein n=1 Tax=Peronospora farinosa TaxID=134698 RepID=A0ABN8CKA8_9STRA|nr:unnamed protein product [Peronospora farinosa]
MRSRLDSVHEATGFLKLPSVGYDLDSVRAEVTLEEQSVLEDLGVDLYANGSQDGGLSQPTQLDSINRKSPPASAHVHSEVYARILRYDDMSQMGAIDARIAGRLHSVNEDVFAEWAQTEGIKYGLPALDSFSHWNRYIQSWMGVRFTLEFQWLLTQHQQRFEWLGMLTIPQSICAIRRI